MFTDQRIFVPKVHRCHRYLFDKFIDLSLCWLYLRLTFYSKVLANPASRLNSHGENYILINSLKIKAHLGNFQWEYSEALWMFCPEPHFFFLMFFVFYFHNNWQGRSASTGWNKANWSRPCIQHVFVVRVWLQNKFLPKR